MYKDGLQSRRRLCGQTNLGERGRGLEAEMAPTLDCRQGRSDASEGDESISYAGKQESWPRG
jgi:hypothetical protein